MEQNEKIRELEAENAELKHHLSISNDRVAILKRQLRETEIRLYNCEIKLQRLRNSLSEIDKEKETKKWLSSPGDIYTAPYLDYNKK